MDCLNCHLVRFSCKKTEIHTDVFVLLLFVDSSSASQHDGELKTNSCCQSCKRRPTPFPAPWKSLSEPEPQKAVAQCGGYTIKGKRRKTGRRKRKRKKVLSNSEKQNLRAIRTGSQPKVVRFLFYCGNQSHTCWLFLTVVINPQCGETWPNDRLIFTRTVVTGVKAECVFGV